MNNKASKDCTSCSHISRQEWNIGNGYKNKYLNLSFRNHQLPPFCHHFCLPQGQSLADMVQSQIMSENLTILKTISVDSPYKCIYEVCSELSD